MNNLNLNIALSVFSVGAMIFLFSPLEFFYAYSIQDIAMTGLLIELVGIIIGAIVFFRYKVTQMYLEEI